MIEILERRTPNEKHFLKENGNVEVQLFREKIHYLKDGRYEEISNQLKENNGCYENLENDFKVIFDKVTGSIKYIKDIFYLEMIPKNMKNFECILVENSKNMSKILYENVFDNIDFEYILSFAGVKENIIVKDKVDINKIEYDIKTNLDLNVLDNVLTAKNNDEIIFSFNVPYMWDEIGNECGEVLYNFNDNTLSVEFNLNWINSCDRKYPVIIDPSLENNDKGVDDTYIYSGDTNDVRYNKDYIISGVERINGQDRINRSLLKFVLPTIGTSDEIIRAQLHLYGYMATNETRVLTEQEALDNTDKLVSIHEVTKDWTLSSANWSDMNSSYNQNVENVAFVARSYLTENLESQESNLEAVISHSKNDCLITDLVKKWYNGSPNYGIMIKQADEVYINSMVPMFFSSNYGEGGLSPVLVIEYRNQNGIEPYMDYATQSFTNGASYVNTFNGNLTTLFNIAHTIGVFPANIGIVYNTNDVILNKNTIYGKGYKLTYDQTIETVTIGEMQKLKFVDGDGTTHYFHESNGKYVDEDGLSLEITLDNTDYVISDKNGNVMTFSKNGSVYYLIKITNISGKEITITRNSDNYITKVVDYNNNTINVIYESNKITFTSPNETTILNYENGNLTTIVTKEGTTLFMYDVNNIVSKITDVTGLSINYEYYSGSTSKIKKITQYGLNNIEGESFTITYGLFNTKITDNKGKITTKVYNYYGNLLSSNSMSNENNLKDAYSIASTYGNSLENKNKILSDTIPIRYSKNYFKLTEYDSIMDDFVFSIDTSIYDEEFEFDGVKAVCIKSTEVNGYIDYGRVIGNGEKWTVSLKIKTLGKARIVFYEWQSHGNLYEKEIENTGEFEKIVYVSNGEPFSFEIINEVSNVNTYIGDIQFEKGDSLSEYNAIDNSDFSDGTNGWTLTASALDTEVLPNVNEVFEVVEIDDEANKALKVNMNPCNMSHVSKIIDVSGTSEDLYYLSFWFKNAGLETGVDPTVSNDSSGSIIGNSVSVFFEPLEGELETCIPSFELNVNKEAWQYYSMPFAPTKDYKSIRIEMHQARESGTLLVTNFSLFKKLKTNRYEYDEHGNITEVKDVKESNVFNYDKNNELISATNPRGKHFKIEYDKNISDRVIRAISSTGISNKVVYDEYGNPIKTKISKDYSEEVITGHYKIRQRGTNEYLKIVDNSLTLKYDYCSDTVFNVEKIDNSYKISDVVMPNKYLVESSNKVILDTTGNYLFKLKKNTNASYHIYLEDGNNKKYLKWNNNTFVFVTNPQDIEENYLYEFYFEDSSKLFIENSATYSQDGRFLESIKDSLLNETTYVTDTTNGLVTKMTNAKNIETNYTYNNKNQITKILQGNKEVNYTYNTQNMLSSIIQGNKIYQFSYNNFLKNYYVKINSKYLVTNTYEEKNGNLLSAVYGNGDSISYQYDEFGRIKKVIKEDNEYDYLYNNNGNLHKLSENDAEAYYIYDEEKRLKEYTHNRYYTTSYTDDVGNIITTLHTNNFDVDNSYDNDNNIIKQRLKLNNVSHEIENTFNKEGYLLETTLDNTNIKYTYDELSRITSKKINDSYETKYDYLSMGNRTSTLINSITNGNDKYSYKYDKLYNITDVYFNNILINHYEYDDYNELIEDVDYRNNTKTEYIYDNQGNILSKIKKNIETDVIISTDTYEYNDSSWEDLLTKYNNESITYDEIGNPLTIGTKTLNWKNGRQLESYTDTALSISYKYNINGIRTEKVVNGVKTEYYLTGQNILYEKTHDNIIYYLYDNTGIIGLRYNNVVYYFVKNLQGDIIGILDQNNTLIVKYEYDSFGNLLSVKDANNQLITDTNNIGIINSFRYRGYYYDKEIGLYYLNSRYYNPKWGRFLNADGIIGANNDMLSNNLFLYVSNNFIKYVDILGTSSLVESFVNKAKKILKKIVEIFSISIKKAINDAPNGTTKPYKYCEGNVYIVKDNQVEEYKQKISENDVLIIDQREQANPNIKIIDSHGIWCDYNKDDIIDIIFEYNEIYPSKNEWKRTKKSVRREWDVHSLLYFVGYKRERTGDVDLDNADEDSIRFNNLFWDIFYM